MDYITVKDFSIALGITARGARKKIEREQIKTKKVGNKLLVCIDSLSPELQEKVNAQRNLTKAPTHTSPFSTPKLVGVSVKLPNSKILDEKVQKKAQIVSLALNVPRGKKKDDWVKEVALKFDISAATIYRYIKAMTVGENCELSEKYLELDGFRIDWGNVRGWDIEALDWSVGVILEQPTVSRGYVFEMLQDKALEEKWRIGSEKRFYFHMKKIPEALLIRSAQGKRGIGNVIAPDINRDLSYYEVLELVVGDQNILDWYVFDDEQNVITPELYMWVDMRSMKIVGITPTLGKYNKYLIGKSLKMACEYAVPQNIYTDNGKPELSHYITQLRPQLAGSKFHDLDELPAGLKRAMGHKKAKVRNSKAKPIEGIFNHLQNRLKNITMGVGYKKYLKKGEQDEQIQNRLKQDIRAGRLFHYKEFFDLLMQAVEWWNTHEIRTRKIVPDEEFRAHLRDSKSVRIDKDTLDFIFMPVKMLKVRSSKIEIKHRDLEFPIKYFAKELGFYAGKKVEVRYNPDDVDHITVVDPQNREIIAIAQRSDAINPKDMKQLKEAMKWQGNVIKAWEEVYKNYTKKYKRPVTAQIGAYDHAANEVVKKTKTIKRTSKTLAMTNEEINRSLAQSLEKTS